MKLRTMALAAVAVAGTGIMPSQAEAQLDLKDALETVGAMMIADRLGIDPNIVLMAKMSSNASVYDMAPAFALSPYTTTSPAQLYAMRSAGLNWDQVAALNGVPTRTYVVLNNQNQFDTNTIWADEFSSRYGLPQDNLYALRRAGYSWKEIARASVTSQETGIPMDEILYRNRLYGDWGSPVRYQTRYTSADPIYIPARRARVAILPAPTVRYVSNWRETWRPEPVVWIDANTWRPQRTRVVRRPIVIEWSPVHVVKQPVYVYDGKPKNKNRYEPIFVQREPVRLAYNDRVRIIDSPIYVQERTRIVRTEPTRVVRYDDSRYDNDETRRAQRFAEDDRDPKDNGSVHSRLNQRTDLTGRELGEKHKSIGGVGSDRDDARKAQVKVQADRQQQKASVKTNVKKREASNQRTTVKAQNKSTTPKKQAATKSNQRTQQKANTQRTQQKAKAPVKRTQTSQKSTAPKRTETKAKAPAKQKQSRQASAPKRTETKAKSRQSGGTNVRTASQRNTTTRQTKQSGGNQKARTQNTQNNKGGKRKG